MTTMHRKSQKPPATAEGSFLCAYRPSFDDALSRSMWPRLMVSARPLMSCAEWCDLSAFPCLHSSLPESQNRPAVSAR